MHKFLSAVESFFEKIAKKLSPPEKDPDKKPGFFDKVDAFFARFDGSFLIWSFFLSAAVMLLIYVAKDVYPFGESSVLVLDLNGQYVQFFAAFRALLHGDGSLLYSFSRSLGGEFLGIYTYYLSSPFSLLVGLFSEEGILEALLLIFVLKAGTAGLTFGAFLHYTERPHKALTVALSILYALSSYSIVMQHNTMWMDGMMLLPLLMLGLHRVIRRKSPILYIATLSLILLCNYYIGYMICIFTVLYFFYDFFSHEKGEVNPTGEAHHFLHSTGRMALYSLMAAGIAAVLLFPAYYSLTFGKTTFTNPDYSFAFNFDILDFLVKMFPGAYDTVRPEGNPFVSAGVPALLLLPLYFFTKRAPREKIASGMLLLALFLSMYIDPIDMFWHGMQAPNWLNYRYSFLFIFVILLLSARTLGSLHDLGYKPILASAGGVIMIAIVLQKLGLTCTTNNQTYEYFDDLYGVWFTLGFVLIYALLFMLLGEHEKDSPKIEPIAMVLTLFICAETLLSGVHYLTRQNEDVVISNYESYHGFYDVYKDDFDYLSENDPDLFYRVDKTFQHTVCDSFVLGYNGLASSTSTLNASTIRFMDKLGLKANSHWSEATGATPASGGFLGVKYWIAKSGEAVDPVYRPVKENTERGTVIYQNPYALPLAFAAKPIKELDFSVPAESEETYEMGDDGWQLKTEYADSLFSPFQRINALYASLTGIDTLTVYDPIASAISTSGSLKKEIPAFGRIGVKTENKESNADRLNFTFTAPDNGQPVYCYFPSQYPREAALYLNGQSFNDTVLYPGCAATASVICLGSFTPGETVTVSLTCFKYGEFYLIDNRTPYFYTLDETDLATATALLREGELKLDRFEDDFMAGTITAREGMTAVQTTIPYDAGWRVSVNGTAVDTYMTADALLAFDLPSAGEHEITLSYRPTLYTVGLVLSIGCLLLFGGLITLQILTKKGKLTLKNRFLLWCLPTEGSEVKNEEKKKVPTKAPHKPSTYGQSRKKRRR